VSQSRFVHTIEVRELTGGRVSVLPAFEALELVMAPLQAHVVSANLGATRLGRMIKNQAQAEGGLFVDLSFTEGAALSVRCATVADRVEMVVGRSSRALRSVAWAGLGFGLAGGLVVAKVAMRGFDPQLALAAGLLGGCAFAVAVMVAAQRSGVLHGGRSAEVAEALGTVVEGWVQSVRSR
jgi:hypothetical protein